jgi:hypothetical protein
MPRFRRRVGGRKIPINEGEVMTEEELVRVAKRTCAV